MNLKSLISTNAINSRGWKTKRKILVIESDDWGGVRMPNKEVREKASKQGLSVENNPYNKFDTLASAEDFDHLFAILGKHRDALGKNPQLTANVVLCNPDFDQIKKNEYSKFFVESFDDTIKRYYPNQRVLDYWQEGMESKLFIPQFHGREHVNAIHWLKALQNNNEVLLKAFDLGFWGVDMEAYNRQVGLNLQATYDGKHEDESDFHKASIIDGLRRFKHYFGFHSKSFIPNNFVFDRQKLNETLREFDVQYIQGRHYHLNPKYYSKENRIQKRIFGMELGMLNLIRNCTFEPAQTKSKNQVVADCYKQVSNAFFWGKPAILTAHRLNFIGSIEERNRRENLQLLDELLTKVIKKNPDVEFMSSADLGDYLLKERAKS